MNQPITAAEGLIFAKSLFKCTEVEERVLDYYQQCKYFDDKDEYCGR